ncbi:MAG: hypothetical protein L3K03_08805 [Thermoplasmata archaeon]|nr:hypothetical protein [Thermoplasmata archaeon]
MPSTARGWRSPRRRLVILAVACATAFIVFAVYLYLPATQTVVTVTKATFIIVEGKTSDDFYYFGPTEVNYTTGFPFNTTPGAHFTIDLEVDNFDTQFPHSIITAQVNAPFELVATSPTLPAAFETLDDSLLIFTFQAPSSTGNYALTTTLETV